MNKTVKKRKPSKKKNYYYVGYSDDKLSTTMKHGNYSIELFMSKSHAGKYYEDVRLVEIREVV